MKRVLQGLVLSFVLCYSRARFTYAGFQNAPSLSLLGEARGGRAAGGELQLTPAKPLQMGAVWYTHAKDIGRDGFYATFEFSITQVENSAAGGMAFVLQAASPYVLGEGGGSLGYGGLRGSSLAVEFDSGSDAQMSDPPGAHVSVHVGVTELDSSETAERSPALVEPGFADMGTVRASVRYDPLVGELQVYVGSTKTKSLAEVEKDPVYSTSLPKDLLTANGYYVGFTAATGSDGAARYALQSWAFEGLRNDNACDDGFAGTSCIVTNDEAARECPRRRACNVCVEDVYNCVWCSGSGSSKSSCVVGTLDNTKTCGGLALEPLGCKETLSTVWLWMLAFAFVTVCVFGFVLYKTLPLVQSFRAISLLVATVGGALSGMAISFITSVSLVEISETPFFAVAFGLFFIAEFAVLAHQVSAQTAHRNGVCDRHTWLLSLSAFWVLLSGVLCFVLEKSWVHYLPENLKIVFYTVLGSALNFCLVFSIVDVGGELWSYCNTPRNSVNRMQGATPTRGSVTQSTASVAILACSSIVSGVWFGFIFGFLRIEEEAQYRVALALQQEAAYTYPVGAVVGAVSALLQQLLQLPLASDSAIDHMLRTGRDGRWHNDDL